MVVLDVVVVVLDVVVLVDVVVVVSGTHRLFSQVLPGAQVPQPIGMPHPLSIVPHWALSDGQSCGVQHTPNLSVGFSVTQSLLLQLLWTWQLAPSGLPPALATPAVANTATASIRTERNLVFINPLLKRRACPQPLRANFSRMMPENKRDGS